MGQGREGSGNHTGVMASAMQTRLTPNMALDITKEAGVELNHREVLPTEEVTG